MTKIRVAVDECVSPRIARALGQIYDRYEFIPVRDLVPARTEDEMWADNFKRFGGFVVLSGDVNIAKRPHQAAAFIDNGFVSFFPSGSWGRLLMHCQAAHLIHSWPRAAKIIEKGVRGACWRMRCSVRQDHLLLDEEEFERLEIPADVLNGAKHDSLTQMGSKDPKAKAPKRRRPTNH